MPKLAHGFNCCLLIVDDQCTVHHVWQKCMCQHGPYYLRKALRSPLLCALKPFSGRMHLNLCNLILCIPSRDRNHALCLIFSHSHNSQSCCKSCSFFCSTNLVLSTFSTYWNSTHLSWWKSFPWWFIFIPEVLVNITKIGIQFLIDLHWSTYAHFISPRISKFTGYFFNKYLISN